MSDHTRALRATIEQFQADTAPDECAVAVLKRLTTDEWSPNVRGAFAIVPRERWPVLIQDCIHAEREMRKHKRIVEHSKAMLAKAKDAEIALETIAKFIALARVGRTLAGHDPVLGALGTLRNEIFYTRRDAERTQRQHSQKTEAAAGRAVGIGWLKASLQAAAPKAANLRRLVADLAEAVLDAGPVSEDAVRHAATPREWLDRAYAGVARTDFS